MKKIIEFNNNSNKYIYSTNKESITLITPSLSEVINNNQQNISNEEFKYQKQKYDYLVKNGFIKSPQKEIFDMEISGDNVLSNFLSISSLSIEVTEACNLNCVYCGYGDFYNFYDKRKDKYINFNEIKALLDFYQNKLKNNISPYTINKDFVINFYGGEPLLNFKVIKETVDYVKKLNLKNIKPQFMMTTNGILLNKYIDFLVENNFGLVISLDGNKKNNSYRITKNGRDSFEIVYKNILQIKNDYPNFYKTNINFNSVLHNKNTHVELYEFFDHLEKETQIFELNTYNVVESKKEEFFNMFKFSGTSFNELANSTFKKNVSVAKDLNMIEISRSALPFNFTTDLKDWFSFGKNYSKNFPTGSCLPFMKSLFLTVNKKILYCERVPHSRVLGVINDNGEVDLDFHKIATSHNKLNKNLITSCNSCYARNYCKDCKLTEEEYKCNEIKKEKDMAEYLSFLIDYIEKNPKNYLESIRKVKIS